MAGLRKMEIEKTGIFWPQGRFGEPAIKNVATQRSFRDIPHFVASLSNSQFYSQISGDAVAKHIGHSLIKLPTNMASQPVEEGATSAL